MANQLAAAANQRLLFYSGPSDELGQLDFVLLLEDCSFAFVALNDTDKQA